MSDSKKKTTKKKPSTRKPHNGLFKQGNEIGQETRFDVDNELSKKYKEEFCDDILIYFAAPEDRILYSESYYKDGVLKSKSPIILPPKFPTFELFAAKLGVVTNTLRNWCETYPRFALAYKQAKNMQLGIAKANAVAKLYDSNFTKFVLTNDHGLSDKSENEVVFKVTTDGEVDKESN